LEELKASHSALTATHAALSTECAALTTRLTERDSQLQALTEQHNALQPKLAEAIRSGEEMLGQKNHWKRKADSLQQQISVLLSKGGGAAAAEGAAKAGAASAAAGAGVAPLDRGGSTSSLLAPVITAGAGGGGSPLPSPAKTPITTKGSRSNSRAEDSDGGGSSGGGWDSASDRSSTLERINRLEKERREAQATIEAYRRAFEQQLAQNKSVKQSAAAAAASPDGYLSQFLEMKKLANTLRLAALTQFHIACCFVSLMTSLTAVVVWCVCCSETISDKDMALAHMKNVNRELGKRIRELETVVGSSTLKLPTAGASPAPQQK
jgi:DNA repair exonuclease SbcCD ATPase subunit